MIRKRARLDSRTHGLATPRLLKLSASRTCKEKCSHDPPKENQNDGSIGDNSLTTGNAQRITRSDQHNISEMDYPHVYGRRFITDRKIKMHRTKMGCLNISANQQQHTAQALGKLKPNLKPQC